MEAKVKVEIELLVGLPNEIKEGHNRVQHLGVGFAIDVTEPLNKEQYVDEDGVPNKNGCFIATSVMVQGLLANIHVSHQQGFRDSAEHLRYIIAELERGFIEVPTIEKGTFDDLKPQG